eukprot:scaffold132481_cov45-Phaeocystis_antarctica.AAC.1
MLGAHVEHVSHGFDSGRVEAQRLVERRRFLPSRNESTRCERGVGSRRLPRGGRVCGRRWRKQRAGRGLTKGCGPQGTRGAHAEHAGHGCDARGIPAGYVRVEVLQLIEERAHVGDGRDIPVGDGAVRRNGRIRVFGEGQDRRLQGYLACE